MRAIVIRNEFGDADNILNGTKTMETRRNNVLKSHIGETIGIITYIYGHAYLVATATVGEPVKYETAEAFDADYELHKVGKDSHYYFRDRKYGYPLTNVKALTPKAVNIRGCNAVKNI